jgi:hypothetical protein
MTSFKNWKVIGGASTAAALLMAVLALSTPTNLVEAERSTNPNPNANIFPTLCPRDLVQHWDKIHFRVLVEHAAGEVKSLGDFDIKVRDDPTKVADLTAKVRDFLAKHPMIEPTGIPFELPTDQPFKIEIVDVEYAIVCSK